MRAEEISRWQAKQNPGAVGKTDFDGELLSYGEAFNGMAHEVAQIGSGRRAEVRPTARELEANYAVTAGAAPLNAFGRP